MKNNSTNSIPQESKRKQMYNVIRRLIAVTTLAVVTIGSAGCVTVTESSSNDAPPATQAETSAQSDADKNTTSDADENLTSDTNMASDDNNEPASDNATFGVGETAEFENVQVTFLGVTESSGSEYNEPADGNIFVLAEFEIANNSENELSISSALSFSAYQDGYSTDYSISALMEANGQLDGTIAPGKKMKGCVGYEIPAEYKELEIDMQLDMWSNDKLVFVYNK